MRLVTGSMLVRGVICDAGMTKKSNFGQDRTRPRA